MSEKYTEPWEEVQGEQDEEEKGMSKPLCTYADGTKAYTITEMKWIAQKIRLKELEKEAAERKMLADSRKREIRMRRKLREMERRVS